MMPFERVAVLAFVASLAGAVWAGEMERKEVVVAVAADDTGGHFKFRFDSDDAGFDLDELQVGESRSVVGDSGETALITREEKGFRIDVNGEAITLPLIEGDHESRVWASGDASSDLDVHVIDAMPHAMDGTVIISDRPIDEATQALIRTTLESAGHGEDVTFIDSESRDAGEHHVKIVKRRVERAL